MRNRVLLVGATGLSEMLAIRRGADVGREIQIVAAEDTPEPTQRPELPLSEHSLAKFFGIGSNYGRRNFPKPQRTVAQDKRDARKARNRRRP